MLDLIKKRKFLFLNIFIFLFIICGMVYYFFGKLNILRIVQNSSIQNICFLDDITNQGENVKIAILDSGVKNNHLDFSNNIKSGYNFITNKVNIDDNYGHGTWITGIIAAQDNNYGICGISPKAELYPLKVLNNEGRGKIEHVVNAINWCIDNELDIINISFSTPKNSKELEKAINLAIQKGIIIVASYDNNDKKASYPAQYKNVIGVKTQNKNDRIYIIGDVCYAPGNDIITTNMKGGYEKVTGNSIAAAIVTGNVALAVSEYKKENKIYNVNFIKNKINKK